MVDPWRLHELLSGQRRDARARVLRAALAAAEPAYRLAAAWRNRRYDSGRAAVARADVPVISVGNLTTGGVGKTPVVAWLARRLRAQGVRVGLVSRGYGAEAGAKNDEALELERQLPDVPHVQCRDRAAGATIAVEELGCRLLVLDDAFQHRRLHRDLDIVLLDALVPFGYGRLLPRGLLREPPASLARAHVIGLTRADQVSRRERAAIRREAARWAPQAAWLEIAQPPARLSDAAGASEPLEAVAGQPVLAFCGVGNPRGFRRSLEAAGCRVVGWRSFPDHHPYRREDVEQLARWAAAHAGQAAAVLCTGKDLVKIGLASLGPLPLRALCARVVLLAGEAALDEALAPLVQQALA